jgi:hypothetical protein
MSAQYECDMCGGDIMSDLPDSVITIHETGHEAEQYHFCEPCTEKYVVPLLKQAIEASEKRSDAWERRIDERARARDRAQEGSDT